MWPAALLGRTAADFPRISRRNSAGGAAAGPGARARRGLAEPRVYARGLRDKKRLPGICVSYPSNLLVHDRGRARSKSARARARQAAAHPPTPLPAPPRPPPRASPRESRRARALVGWSHRVSLVRGRRRALVRGGSGWACGGRGGAPPARAVMTALFRARAQKAAPPPQRAPGARATARRHSPDSVSLQGAGV